MSSLPTWHQTIDSSNDDVLIIVSLMANFSDICLKSLSLQKHMDMSSENDPFMISYINDSQTVKRNDSRIAVTKRDQHRHLENNAVYLRIQTSCTNKTIAKSYATLHKKYNWCRQMYTHVCNKKTKWLSKWFQIPLLSEDHHMRQMGVTWCKMRQNDVTCCFVMSIMKNIAISTYDTDCMYIAPTS